MQFEATKVEETRLKMNLKEDDVKLWLTSHGLNIVHYISRIMPTIQYYLKKNREIEVNQHMFDLLDSKDKRSIKHDLISFSDLRKVCYFISCHKLEFIRSAFKNKSQM